MPLQQHADVVAGLTFVEQFAEHFNTRAGAFGGVFDADDFNFIPDFDDTTLDSAGDDSASTGNGEDVFHGHQEVAINRALRLRNVVVQGFATSFSIEGMPISEVIPFQCF